MRHLLFTVTAISTLIGFATSSFAADMTEMLHFDWSGIFAGAQIGKADGDASYKNISNDAVYAGDVDGRLYGIRAGYRHQMDMVVMGISADLNAADIGGRGDDGFDGAFFDVNWFGSIDAQLGFSFDRLLVYGIGGLAFAGVQHDYDSGTFGGNDNSYDEKTHTGFTIGAGLDFAVTENVAFRLEARHYDFGSKEFGQVLDIIPHTVEADFQTVTLGVEFKL